MNFVVSADLPPYWFNSVYPRSLDDPYYLITQSHLAANTCLFVEDFPMAARLDTFFSVGQVSAGAYVSQGAQALGFVLHSKYPSKSLSSAVLAYTASAAPLEPPSLSKNMMEARLVLRTHLFYTYHSVNRATLAANPHASAKVHEALTSV